MKAPQIIFIVLIAINALVTANQHGKSKGDYNIFYYLLVDVPITIGLLIWGGFFN